MLDLGTYVDHNSHETRDTSELGTNKSSHNFTKMKIKFRQHEGLRGFKPNAFYQA